MSLAGIADKEDFEGSGSVFGRAPQNVPTYPKGTKLRMFCGSLDDPTERSTAEDLLTKSLHGGGYLKDPGDVVVLDREGSFDKQGVYHVYLYYAELPVGTKTEDGDNKKDSR